MTVLIGDIITASQYNILSAGINTFWADNYSSNTPADPKSENSKGWGQTAVGTVSTGAIINDTDTNELINRINIGVLQTGVGTPITKVANGNTILASEHNNIESQIAIIDASSNVANDFTITSGGTAGTGSRGSWSSSITVTVTATFSSYAEARYFFNTGGQLRYSLGNNGSSNDALAWQDVFDGSDMGTLVFGFDNISQTGTRPGNLASNSGFYELTTSPTEFYNINLDESPYTQNDMAVQFSRNSSGTQVIATFTLNNDDPQAETVDGTTTIYLDTRKADNKSETTPAVSFAVAAPTTFAAGTFSGS